MANDAECETRINNRPVDELDFAPMLAAERRFFENGKTRPYEFRRKQLESLGALVRDNEDRIHEALAADLGKPPFEAYASEVGFLHAEVGFALENLGSWMKPERVRTPLVLFPSRSLILREPVGNVLIIGPWNYPFQLVMAPLVGALAAGNTAVLKPSEWAAHTSELVAELVARYFPPELVSTVTGDATVAEALVRERFDHIFFTGGAAIGKRVARAAAEHLTPVTLELGGKSPVIVDTDVDLPVAARRIVWGKFLNAGQTCIAPDYLLAPAAIESELLDALERNIHRFFGEDPYKSRDFARILNRRHFDRLQGYLGEGRLVTGGQTEPDELYIAPTVIRKVPEEARVLSEEIFGPVLPVLTYEELDDALARVRRHPDPLALYVFSRRTEVIERVLSEIPFGGGAVNDCLVQFSNRSLPFGGRGASGFGSYHGRYSFEVFSHRKSIVKSSTRFDPSLRYPPYGDKLRWLKKFLR